MLLYGPERKSVDTRENDKLEDSSESFDAELDL